MFNCFKTNYKATAFIVSMVLVTMILGVTLLNTNYTYPYFNNTPSESFSNDIPEDSNIPKITGNNDMEEIIVITAEEYYDHRLRGGKLTPAGKEKNLVTGGVSDTYLKKPGELFVSDLLDTKMELYKNDDVLFRVRVNVNPYSGRGQIDIDQWWESEELKAKVADAFLDYAIEIGARNIKSHTDEICIKNFLNKNINYLGSHIFVMELSADAIIKIADGYVCSFMLIQPERIEGYNDKISNHLTIALSNMSEDDTVHIAAVSAIDNNYNYLKSRNMISPHLWEDRFNELKYEEYFSISELNNVSLNKYIDLILERNNIVEKRIIQTDEYSDVSVSYNQSDSCILEIKAGFEATLTRDEIMKLAEDADIMNIYIMS